MRMPIPDDWDGATYCRYAVCWPASPKWLAILRGQATEIARGWFWDERSGNLLETLDQARSTLDQNIALDEVIMACNDAGLKDIATALKLIALNQCCGESVPDNGGVQGVTNDGFGDVPIFGGVPPIGVLPGEIPEGWDGTLEEYLQSKCNSAQAILDGVIQTCNTWGSINFASTAGLVTLLVLALAGWIIVPAYLITLLIAASIGLVGIQAALFGLADGIEARRNDIVCIMLESDTTTEIVGRLSQVIASIISLLGVSGPMGAFLRLVAGILFSTDTLNQLFETVVASFGDRVCDCTGCDPLNDLLIDFDTDVNGFAIDVAFGGTIPEYQGSNGTWAQAWQAGSLRYRLTNSANIANTHVLAVRSIDHDIGTGDHLLSEFAANTTVTYHLALFDDTKQFIASYSIGTATAGPIDVDLSPYAGQHAAYVVQYVAKAAVATYYCENLGISIICSV